MDGVTTFWIVAALLALVVFVPLYFLPAIVGSKKRSRLAIFASNLLLGWTGIGWIALLLWALSSDAPGSAGIHRHFPGSIGIAEFCDECEHYSIPGSQCCCHCGKPFESCAA